MSGIAASIQRGRMTRMRSRSLPQATLRGQLFENVHTNMNRWRLGRRRSTCASISDDSDTNSVESDDTNAEDFDTSLIQNMASSSNDARTHKTSSVRKPVKHAHRQHHDDLAITMLSCLNMEDPRKAKLDNCRFRKHDVENTAQEQRIRHISKALPSSMKYSSSLVKPTMSRQRSRSLPNAKLFKIPPPLEVVTRREHIAQLLRSGDIELSDDDDGDGDGDGDGS